MVLCATTQEVVFLRHLPIELFIVLKHPAMMMEDNTISGKRVTQGCNSFATNGMTTSKSKHINDNLYFVRDAICDKYIGMQWCSTHNMIADILTKFPLSGDHHSRLASRMMFGKFSDSKALV